jgi:5-formyltetrahydrofolate cyclo-ligase
MSGMSTAAQPYPLPPGAARGGVTQDAEQAEHAKEALRKAIRAGRAARSERRRQEAAAAFADVLGAFPPVRTAQCAAVYASRPGEPDTLPLLERLADRGLRILMPVLGTGLQRDWAPYDGAADLRQRAPGRPPEPGTPHLGAGALAEADVIIAPALAVDTSGARLGQGGGWYDRALEHAAPGTPVVAMVFAEEVYDAEDRPLPRQPHDRPVDAVATPEGWRWLRSADGE